MVKLSLKENAHGDETSVSTTTKPGKVFSTIHQKKPEKRHYGNLKQIFILAFDALRERKARSILTILMVVTGGGLMVALNGMSAGVVDSFLLYF